MFGERNVEFNINLLKIINIENNIVKNLNRKLRKEYYKFDLYEKEINRDKNLL